MAGVYGKVNLMTDDTYLSDEYDDSEPQGSPLFRRCATCQIAYPQQYLYVDTDGRAICMDCDTQERKETP
jgi:hypothetical protein